MTTTPPRHRTLGGATITLIVAPAEGVTATCNGCGRIETTPLAKAPTIGRTVQELTTSDATAWARRHATTCTSWPPNVILRAVNHGGAWIDIVLTETNGRITVTGTCVGCAEGRTDSCGARDHDEPARRRSRPIATITNWARAHATCPFMPRPAS